MDQTGRPLRAGQRQQGVHVLVDDENGEPPIIKWR